MIAKPSFLIPAALLLGANLVAQGGVAVYEFTFNSTWSQATHPKDFPSNPHFSPLIGGTHNASVHFWMGGGIATPGIEQMAETGGTSLLRGEIQTHINNQDAKSIISGGGLGSPASITLRFEVCASHPHVTIVSMLAPSPDWFVGVSGVNLIAKGQWVDQMVLDAHVYDAGTDSGTTYTSPNQNTSPQDKIAKVTTQSGPFMNTTTMVGTFTIKRIASTLVYGCGINPKDSLTIDSGTPLLGQSVKLSVHDPLKSMSNGSMTFLILAATPDSSFPCGTKVPGFGFGQAGATGELLFGQLIGFLGGAKWQGNPVQYDLAVPNQASLVGANFFAQGAIGDNKRLGLTDAAEFHIGK